MYKITANQKGTREISVSSQHLATIKQYSLLSDLIGSHGIITDETLEKLRMNTRALLESGVKDENLVSLLADVLYHNDMKAFGLHQLVTLFLHHTEPEQTNAE